MSKVETTLSPWRKVVGPSAETTLPATSEQGTTSSMAAKRVPGVDDQEVSTIGETARTLISTSFLEGSGMESLPKARFRKEVRLGRRKTLCVWEDMLGEWKNDLLETLTSAYC